MCSIKHYPPEGFTERLYRSFLKSGLEITQVSNMTGLARSSVYSYILDGVSPNVSALAKLCKVLGVSADYLLFGKR